MEGISETPDETSEIVEDSSGLTRGCCLRLPGFKIWKSIFSFACLAAVHKWSLVCPVHSSLYRPCVRFPQWLAGCPHLLWQMYNPIRKRRGLLGLWHL